MRFLNKFIIKNIKTLNLFARRSVQTNLAQTHNNLNLNKLQSANFFLPCKKKCLEDRLKGRNRPLRSPPASRHPNHNNSSYLGKIFLNFFFGFFFCVCVYDLSPLTTLPTNSDDRNTTTGRLKKVIYI